MIEAYLSERREYSEYKEKVGNFHAKIIVKKLARHFKLRIIYVEFYGYRDSGQASMFGGRIRLSNNPSIGIICHEVNHFLCWKKYGTKEGKARHGSKKWYRQLNRIVIYTRRKDFWKEEYKKRITPKPTKPEQTKEEARVKRIQQLEKRKKKYERKIRLSENRIKKLNKQVSGLKRFL